MFQIIVIVIANLYWRLTACQTAYKVIYMVHGSHKTFFHFSADETDVFCLKFLKQDSNPGSVLACCNTWHFVALKKKKKTLILKGMRFCEWVEKLSLIQSGLKVCVVD